MPDTTPNVPLRGERLLAGGGRQTLLAFDLSTAPADQIVVSAALRLYKAWGPTTTLVTSSVTSPWTEATTFNTRPTLGAEVVTYCPLDEAMAEEAAALDDLARRPIYQNVSLPSSGIHGSRITWTSSDSSHLSADGVVTRPRTPTRTSR